MGIPTHVPAELGPDTVKGLWTLVKHNGATTSNERRWYCTCQCGTARWVKEQHLKHGKSRSCGCTRAQVLAASLSHLGGWR